jgi:hypothetical protein
MTVSEGMFSSRKIIQQLSSLSKARHLMDRPRRRIDSTITCMYCAAAGGHLSYSRYPSIPFRRLFSCCCARISPIWLIRPVCKCYTTTWGCDNTCIANHLIDDSLFYSIGIVSGSPCIYTTTCSQCSFLFITSVSWTTLSKFILMPTYG